MPTYRNDSRGTVIIKNIDGVPCPIGPKESIATLEEVCLPGLSLVDSNPAPDLPEPEKLPDPPEVMPEPEPKPEKVPEIEPEPEPEIIELEPEPEPEPITEPEPEKKTKWYNKFIRRKNHADLSQ